MQIKRRSNAGRILFSLIYFLDGFTTKYPHSKIFCKIFDGICNTNTGTTYVNSFTKKIILLLPTYHREFAPQTIKLRVKWRMFKYKSLTFHRTGKRDEKPFVWKFFNAQSYFIIMMNCRNGECFRVENQSGLYSFARRTVTRYGIRFRCHSTKKRAYVFRVQCNL